MNIYIHTGNIYLSVLDVNFFLQSTLDFVFVCDVCFGDVSIFTQSCVCCTLCVGDLYVLCVLWLYAVYCAFV